jgi:hypothetical protein
VSAEEGTYPVVNTGLQNIETLPFPILYYSFMECQKERLLGNPQVSSRSVAVEDLDVSTACSSFTRIASKSFEPTHRKK